jgi:hypothetical protein
MIVGTRTAPPELRDAFLTALDSNNRSKATELASHLVECTNRLPSPTCADLGLPFGSCYSQAAERVLAGCLVERAPLDVRKLAAMAKGTPS